MGDTGCFTGQVESRALASGGLPKLGRGQEQLRARSGPSLGNQLPPTHSGRPLDTGLDKAGLLKVFLHQRKTGDEGNGH